jgi:hypothetical protein
MQSFFESHVCVKTGILRGLRELASHQFPNTFQKKKDLTSSRLSDRNPRRKTLRSTPVGALHT